MVQKKFLSLKKKWQQIQVGDIQSKFNSPMLTWFLLPTFVKGALMAEWSI